MRLTRISITIPRDLLAEADRRARALARSRSWLLVEAVRAYLGREPAAARPTQVSESEPPAYAAEAVAAARRRHLAADLKRSPAERLRRAEELARLARLARPARARHQVVGFDSYEDFYEWKKAHRAGA